MNDHEAERIAAAMHSLRPDWPTSSVLTLVRKHLIDRPRRDVTVALSWVACESNSATPARVLEAGPWWQAAGVEGRTTPGPEKVDRRHRCGICSMHRDKCAQLWRDDHEFDDGKRDPFDVAGTIQALKADMPPPPPVAEPTTTRTPHGPDCVRAVGHTGPCLPPTSEPQEAT